jgi:hypothetical protein
MTITLYRPGLAPEPITEVEFLGIEASTQVIQNTSLAARLLGCSPALVDVLANGTGYLIYSVFDYEGDVNTAAMIAFTELTGIGVNADDDDEVLQGPVLFIQY